MRNHNNSKQLTRRKFLGSFTGLMAGTGLMGAVRYPGSKKQGRNIYDPLTAEEEKIINASRMVKEIEKLPGKGFSCAGSIFMAALKYMNKPGNIVDAAAAFGGGMGQRDLCGFLTGGIMALGISAGRHHKERKEIKAHARKLTKEYWAWWQSMAPLHCADLRTKYDRQGFNNMLKRVAVKIEELINKK